MAKKISDEEIYNRILERCGQVGPEKSVTPAAIAQSLTDTEWQNLLKRIRRTAVHQAHAGHIYIMRKGKPADPDDFKGVYKLRIVPDTDWEKVIEDQNINKGSGIVKQDEG